ncbi:MAG: InlB B-repeat-containing protein [Acutalibacteraceae bacterium]
MKKALSLFLAVLMLFSISAVTFASAEGEEKFYSITFVDYDGTELAALTVAESGIVKAPENPTRASTETVNYVFKGWSSDGGQTIYHASTIPLATSDVTYTAIYGEQKVEKTTTFWNFIQSIFARINAVFEYFARIFGREG